MKRTVTRPGPKSQQNNDAIPEEGEEHDDITTNDLKRIRRNQGLRGTVDSQVLNSQSSSSDDAEDVSQTEK